MIIVADSLNEGWYRMLRVLMDGNAEDKFRSAPRGMQTNEILGAQLRIRDPLRSIVGVEERGLNYSFMCAEALWMLFGLNRIDLIEPYNKSLGKFASDPGASHLQGAYGPKLIDEIDYVVDVLMKDPDSRQALISIWRPRPRASADIPCTISMQFMIREGRLHMHTYMRSQDVWLGTPYDVFSFTFIQQFIAYRLNVAMGSYVHTMGSLHAYERNFEDIDKVLQSRISSWVDMRRPEMTDAPVALVMALYIRLTAVTPGFAFPEVRERFVLEWWDDVRDCLGGAQPWTDLLAVCARRFHPSFDKWEGAWDLLKI